MLPWEGGGLPSGRGGRAREGAKVVYCWRFFMKMIRNTQELCPAVVLTRTDDENDSEFLRFSSSVGVNR